MQVTIPLSAMGIILRYSTVFADETTKAKTRPSDHIKLVEAIRDGTVDKAINAMREYIIRNWKRTREHVEERLESDQKTNEKPPVLPRKNRKEN